MSARTLLALSVTVLSFAALLRAQERGRPVGSRASGRSGVVVMGAPRDAGPERIGQGWPGSRNRNTTQDPRPQNETTVALDPLAPLNVVGGTNDYRYGDAQAGVAVSFDGGLTWTADTLDGLDPLTGKYGAQGDPSVAAYPGGVFYYSYIDFNRGDAQNRLCVARSSDGGLTWPQVGVVVDNAGPGSHPFEDKELIAVDATGGAFDGNVYIAWTRYDPGFFTNRVMVSRSTDGGATFSAPAQISDLADGCYQGTSPAVGPNGEVYVAWYHCSTIQLDDSGDGGATFGADVTVAAVNDISNPIPGSSFRVFTFPSLAVDTSGGANDGTLYVVWADESGPTGDPDILLARSTNGGVTWSAPIRVSDDTNASYQWMPAIAVGPDGTVTVSFLDERDFPGTGQYHAYATQSTDGGLSFRRNARVSNEASNSFLDGFGGGFIGDYSGVAVARNRFVPYWSDCRPSNGNAEGYARVLRVSRP
jgi:hypothetical protein